MDVIEKIEAVTQQTQLDTPADEQASKKEAGKSKNKDLQRTKLCIYHAQGLCTLGDDCTFAHSVSQMRSAPNLSKTQLCKAYMNGHCPRKNCSYAHGESELVNPPNFKKKLCHWHAKGQCNNGAKCGFAHSVRELADPSGVDAESLKYTPFGDADWDASTVAPSSRHGTDISSVRSGASGGSMRGMPDENLYRMIAGRRSAPLKNQVASMGNAIADLQTKLTQMEGVMSPDEAAEMQNTIKQLSQHHDSVETQCHQMRKETEPSKASRSLGRTDDKNDVGLKKRSNQVKKPRPMNASAPAKNLSEMTVAAAWQTYGPKVFLILSTITLMMALELYMR